MTRLAIAHFNDVYRVSPQKLDPHASEVIDVTQFAAMLDDVRAKWVDDGTDGLSLFSGDLFSPSVESSVTRGSHMVSSFAHVSNLPVDLILAGNTRCSNQLVAAIANLTVLTGASNKHPGARGLVDRCARVPISTRLPTDDMTGNHDFDFGQYWQRNLSCLYELITWTRISSSHKADEGHYFCPLLLSLISRLL